MAFRPSGVLGVLLLCVLVALTGCSSKNITSKGPFVLQEPTKGYPSVPSSSGQKTGTVYLPSDDGRPLTKAEQEAFLSEGEIDRNLPQEELGDVLLHFKYLVHKDRYTVEKNLERAQLYMPFIYETLRSRGLPRELAYVAFIESGYNPMATSSSGAAGMWQFRARASITAWSRTGGWMSAAIRTIRGRRRIIRQAYKMFNDWHLAVTAYNAGEGKIQRKSPLRAPRRSRSCAARTSRFTVSGIACPMRTSSIPQVFGCLQNSAQSG
ncbi:MAG: transglycosylase SLT domain-containing protein [Bilophila wadsworthia]